MGCPQLPASTRRSIESVAEIEKGILNQRSIIDRISDRITAFVGSFTFVTLHVLWFIFWVALNYAVEASGRAAFDPYPYIFLNLALSIEAVLLSTFILITQNRQSRQADQWTHLDLQVNLLAEREATKMLRMLNSICAHLGLEKPEDAKELKELTERTHVEKLADQVGKARGFTE
jgi:uncharacterized membrane protein